MSTSILTPDSIVSEIERGDDQPQSEEAPSEGISILSNLIGKYLGSSAPVVIKDKLDTESLPKINIPKKICNIALIYACKRGLYDLAAPMIEYGADSLTLGLKYACEYNHKSLAVLMLQHGAYIDHSEISLNTLDIDLLVKNGIKQFGKYQAEYLEWKKYNTQIKQTMGMLMDKDVAGVIDEY